MILLACLFILNAVIATQPTHHRPAPVGHGHQHIPIHRGECRENHRNYQNQGSQIQFHKSLLLFQDMQ
jgi:hypothetical protein